MDRNCCHRPITIPQSSLLLLFPNIKCHFIQVPTFQTDHIKTCLTNQTKVIMLHDRPSVKSTSDQVNLPDLFVVLFQHHIDPVIIHLLFGPYFWHPHAPTNGSHRPRTTTGPSSPWPPAVARCPRRAPRRLRHLRAVPGTCTSRWVEMGVTRGGAKWGEETSFLGIGGESVKGP